MRSGGADGTLTWRRLWAETADRLGDAREARWILEEVSGFEEGEWAEGLREPAGQRAVARLDAMVARRLAGEPLQYVLGRWSFRTLDLFVDRRVLIPRPETELVVEAALAEARARIARRITGAPLVIVDLGTGSGAIGLSMAAELPIGSTEVWAVEISPDAANVARANLTGLGGRHARYVRVVEGSWFDALPCELEGRLDVVVANPPYIADDEVLPKAVSDWEPSAALRAGPTGLEAYEQILRVAPRWMRQHGVVVAEMGATQADAVAAVATRAGLVDVEVGRDLADRDRILIARQP